MSRGAVGLMLALACTPVSAPEVVATTAESGARPRVVGEVVAAARPERAAQPRVRVDEVSTESAARSASGVSPRFMADDVPTRDEALRGWLHAAAYRGWGPQTDVRVTGEHGGERLYFNATLVASMRAGRAEHPIGSAAVRELYAGDLTTLKGFAVMRKTGPSGPTGEGWYWYELFVADAQPTVAEAGARECVGCHSHAVDFVHPPESLREDPQPRL